MSESLKPLDDDLFNSLSGDRLCVKRSECRLCGSRKLSLGLNFPHTHIADRYSSSPDVISVKFPIDIYQCQSCGHVQHLDIIPLQILFSSEYTYKPSNNPALREHFSRYANILYNKLGFLPQKCLDIGSNDGLYLNILRETYSCEVTGIDPADAPIEVARSNGINCYREFFTLESANKLLSLEGKFDYISANNVFAHNDDLKGFATGITTLLCDDGVFSFECSYLVDIIDKVLVGTIFHEHVSHHSLLSIKPFLESFGLYLCHAERVDTQGGALLVFASKSRSFGVSKSLQNLLDQELSNDINNSACMSRFRSNYLDFIYAFRSQLMLSLPHSGRVIGFGASRSANFLIEVLQLQGILEVILDDNTEKCGNYLFGTDIEIVERNTFEFKENDLIIPLAWIHSSKIASQLSRLNIGLNYLSIYPEVQLLRLQ